MATIAGPHRDAASGEERFFRTMAFVMAAVLVAGFGFNAAMGRSSFTASPLLLHVHAFVFFGWVTLYVTQNLLVAGGNVALHRRLGWLATFWVPAMVAMGMWITVWSLQAHGGPPFFDQNEFLVSNPMGLLYFAGMAAAAIRLRRRTDWHRRLMFSGMAVLTGPGFGRLLPMPFLIPWAWWISAVGAGLLFIGIGMIADKRRDGGVHPAWWVAAGVLVAVQLVADLIAYSPVGVELTRWLLEGTPGAARSMEAFFPPM
ncbi:hypothetical protein ACFQ1E_08835 [Sphingomonas canadensis]|uniref:Adenylate cyclase n=1 Tax=Sphingomonas canadensis TaxID=1219257 RepID=A0ABW3H7P8_9SPHN|nr:hypothetical protein [Sphingomonas canadensis]MCW3836145.1 hypothetical protein [Sphingomonas canadensis]